MLPRWIKRPYHLARLKDPAYRFLFEPGPEDEAVSIDCETTGLDLRKDDIVTIAAVKVRGNRILTSEKFEAVVRPAAKMNVEAIKVHRLRERDVAMGRAMAEVLPPLLHFIGGRPLDRVLSRIRRRDDQSLPAALARHRFAQSADRGLRTLLRAQIRRRAAGDPCRSRRFRAILRRPRVCPFSTSTTPTPTRS